MDDGSQEQRRVNLVAKWGKERITLCDLESSLTIGAVKELLAEKTGVLRKRQKLIGLSVRGGSKLHDEIALASLKVKNGKKSGSTDNIVHEFIMMGTKEHQIFVDPSERDDLPDVVDDFDLDFNAGSHEVGTKSCDVLVFPRSSLYLTLMFCSGYNMWPMVRI